MDIYGFVLAGFLITMGTLGDRIGRRRLLLIGAAAFGAASVLTAFSGSAQMLIVTRVDARTLIVCTPAGFERYFDPMSARAAGVEPPAEAMEPWPEVTTVGPRIGECPGGP